MTQYAPASNVTPARLHEEKGEEMKLQLMFLLMDVLMLLACGFFGLKVAFVRALRRHAK
jgi:hypothetical protein